jgi:hypothetical protein
MQSLERRIKTKKSQRGKTMKNRKLYKVLKNKFDYVDGDLIYKDGRRAGKAAGAISTSHGYRNLNVEGKVYLAHRMIYLYCHGYLPPVIDHIDTDKLNNRIENLRPATKEQNGYNAKLSKANTSGIKGVSWHKATQKWQVVLKVKKKHIWLGCYADVKDAEAAVKEHREQLHGEFTNHGDKAA